MALFTPVFLVFTVSCFGKTDDSIPFRHHKIQIDPISLLGGTLVANYECRITPVHALAIEGYYTSPQFGSKKGAGLQYRHYYTHRNFWGIFANQGEISAKIPPLQRGDTTTCTLDLSYLTIGANWGRNWFIKKRFPIIFRIGAGYPVKSDFSWRNGVQPLSYASMFEALFRFSAALDSELTIGVNF